MGREIEMKQMQMERRMLVQRAFTVLLLLSLSTLAAANGGVRARQCNSNTATVECEENERCVSQLEGGGGRCECKLGYELLGDECIETVTTVAPDATTVRPDLKYDSGGGSVAAGLLIPTFLIIIGVVLYFGARRYRWLQRFRQYRQSRYGNVLVTRDDDDDDDSPIA